MAEGPGQVVLVGAQEDGALARLGHGGTPDWGPPRGERIKDAAVGNHDEPERSGIAPTEAGPVGGTIGGAGEVEGDGALGGPGDDRDPADLDGGRRRLQQEGER
jgi:hypothetical protein